MTMTETIGVEDRAVAATIGTALGALRMTGTVAAARTAPESTGKGLGDNPEASPGAGPGPALGHRVLDRTLRLHPILRRSHGTDTRVLTPDQPPGLAHDPAPGLAGNLEADKGNRSRLFLT